MDRASKMPVASRVLVALALKLSRIAMPAGAGGRGRWAALTRKQAGEGQVWHLLSPTTYAPPLPSPRAAADVHRSSPMAMPMGVLIEKVSPTRSALLVAMPAWMAAEPRARPSKNCGNRDRRRGVWQMFHTACDTFRQA